MKYYRCPVCDKTILFRDEIFEHSISEHGHTPDYLQGYTDAKAEEKIEQAS